MLCAQLNRGGEEAAQHTPVLSEISSFARDTRDETSKKGGSREMTIVEGKEGIFSCRLDTIQIDSAEERPSVRPAWRGENDISSSPRRRGKSLPHSSAPSSAASSSFNSQGKAVPLVSFLPCRQTSRALACVHASRRIMMLHSPKNEPPHPDEAATST